MLLVALACTIWAVAAPTVQKLGKIDRVRIKVQIGDKSDFWWKLVTPLPCDLFTSYISHYGIGGSCEGH